MSDRQPPASQRAWLVLEQPGHPPVTVDLDGELTIGRDTGEPAVPGHLATAGDPAVSRLHAVLLAETDRMVRAGNLCRQRAVRQRNSARIRVDASAVARRRTPSRRADRHRLPLDGSCVGRPVAHRDRSAPPELTAGERRVLLALCSPVLSGDVFTPPASVATIAGALCVTESAVKQQLGRLYLKFDVEEGSDRRVRLANEALTCGAVRVADLQAMRSRRSDGRDILGGGPGCRRRSVPNAGLLAAGGEAEVHLARDLDLDLDVVLKTRRIVGR